MNRLTWQLWYKTNLVIMPSISKAPAAVGLSSQLIHHNLEIPVWTIQLNHSGIIVSFVKILAKKIQNWWIIYYFSWEIPFHQPLNTSVFVAVSICLRESNKSQVTWCFSCLATEVIEALGDPLGSLGEGFFKGEGWDPNQLCAYSGIIILPTQTDPNNALLKGKSLKITPDLYCLIPPKLVI